jgi:hypothetical protein
MTEEELEELKKQIRWILYEASPEQVEAGLMQHPEFRKIKEKMDKMKEDNKQ